MSIPTALRVFLSSTCYDLADIRFELSDYLDRYGVVVKVSDNPLSEFYVDPDINSIDNCLANIANASVLVCIIDRRYGPMLKGKYGDLSATHEEVRYAREVACVPAFFFIREKAISDYQVLLSDLEAETKWVETGEPKKITDQRARDDLVKRRKRYVEFVQYCSRLVPSGWSNWYDTFRNVVDLKKMVLGRLIAAFPNQVGVHAVDLSRALRLMFARVTPNGWPITIEIQNFGPGPALYLRHGARLSGADFAVETAPVLAEGGSPIRRDVPFKLTAETEGVLFCEYEDRAATRYRIEIPVQNQKPKGQAGFAPFGPEKFFVARIGSSPADWVQLR